MAGDTPPTEFRIFASGPIDTTKGSFTFDEASAAAVMADYTAHGIDLMIDYDHASLSPMPVDPALSARAAGWFKLAVRNGELWAVDVRWTDPAKAALTAKEWRFMSPAFTTDDAGRVTSLLNVALTNMPATRQLDPLMAAGRKTIMAGAEALSPKLVAAALEAVATKDAKGSLDLLKQIIAALLGGTPEEAPASAPAEGEPPMAAADKPPADDTAADVAASAAKLLRITGAKSFVEAVATVDTFRASHLELETERQKLAAERATLEAAERRRGCVDLVTVAGMAPAMVWADDKATTPKTYLASMAIGDFRSYVADALKAAGKTPPPIAPPAGVAAPVTGPGGGVAGLSARELTICKETGCDPVTYATLKAQRDGAAVGGN